MYLLFFWKESEKFYGKLLFLKFLLMIWIDWLIENFNYWNQFVNHNNILYVKKLYVLIFGANKNINFLIRFLIQCEDMFICVWMLKCIAFYLYQLFIISFICTFGTKIIDSFIWKVRLQRWDCQCNTN